MMAADTAAPFLSEYWNIYDPTDVNADGAVSPVDALLVIDQLNSGGSRSLSATLAAAIGEGEQPASSESDGGYIDVNNDGFISPVDALLVIDALNAEGEPGDEMAFTYHAFLPGTDTPLPGNTLNVGQEFDLVVRVDDMRAPATGGNKRGVATAYLDVLLSDPSLISVAVFEGQELKVLGSPNGGSFRLSLDNGVNFTDPILWGDIQDGFEVSAVANDIETKLQARFGDAIAPTDFEVRYNSTEDTFTVSFVGKFLEQNVPTLVVDNDLTGGTTPSVQVTQQWNADVNDPEAFDEAFRSRNPTPSGATAFYQFDVNADNLGNMWDDVGAGSLITADPYPGLAPRELVRVRVNAENAGTLTFGSDILNVQNPDHYPTLYSRSTEQGSAYVPFSLIDEPDNLIITINELITANPDTITLNEDSPAFTFNPITSAISGVVTDTDNQAPFTALTISAVNGVTTATSAGTAVTLPSGSTVFFGTSTTITYTPAANLSGTAAEIFTYTITDGTSTDTTTVTVNLTAQNDAPVNRINNVVINNTNLTGGLEDTAFAFTGTRTLTVGDVDFVASETMQVTLSVPPAAGTLTLANTTGLSFTSGSNGSSSMTFTGTLASINAALATLTYNPALHFNGTAVLTIQSNDLGNTGGAPLTSTAANSTVNIAVLAVNDPPVNTVPAQQTVFEDDLLVISPAISIADPDAASGAMRTTLSSTLGRPITVSGGGAAVITGNGTANVQIDGTLAQINLALTTVTYLAGGPTPPGNPDIITVVTNDLGSTGGGPLTDTDQIAVTVNAKKRPQAFPDSPPNLTEGSASYVIDVLGNDLVNDIAFPGTVPVLVGITMSPPASQGTVATNDNGTPAVPEDDFIVFTPVSTDFFGTVTFEYEMNDTSSPTNDGPSRAIVTLVIAGVNDNPVANPDGAPYSVDEDPASPGLQVNAAAGVLVNDTDLDNNFDINGDGVVNASDRTNTLTAVLVTNASNGIVTLNADGSFTYQPNLNFNGSDSFTYKVQDGAGGESNVATVSLLVNPINDPPVANANNYTTLEDTDLVVDGSAGKPSVLTNDTDPEIGSPQETDLDVAVVAGTLIPRDALNVQQGTVSMDLETGLFTYDPPANFAGTVTFTYFVTDGSLQSLVAGTVTIVVTPDNDAPVAVDDPNVTVNEDTSVVINVLVNDTDVDSTSLFVNEPLEVGPTNGTITFNANGTLTYTPNSNYFGPDSFQYRVRDNLLAVSANIATVTINVQAVNDRPVAVNDTPATGVVYSTTEDTALVAAVSVLANDTDVEIGTALETDLDVANVAGTLIPRDGLGTQQGTVNMDVETGLFTYNPPLNFNGTVTFTYFVTDGSLQSLVAATVQITVGAQNDAPTAGDDTFTAIKDIPNQIVPVLGNDTDPEGDTLTVTEVTAGVGPDAGTVVLVSGQIQYTPKPGYSGPDSFTYKVEDGNGGEDIGTVNVTVIAFVPKIISGTVFIDGDGDGKIFAGEAFVDANSNGVFDSGEAFTDTVGGPRDNNVYDAAEKRVQGVTVRLSGVLKLTDQDPGVAITPIDVVTDVQGRYEFRGDATTQFLGVAPGEYVITEFQPAYLTDGLEANNVVGSLATQSLASRIADNQFQASWTATSSLDTSHLAGLDFGEAGLNAGALAANGGDSSGMIQEVLASSGKNGFVLATDLAGNSIWSWCLPGWSNLSKIQLILSADLSSATLRIWDAANANSATASHEITIYQQPSLNDGTDSPPAGSMARFRVLGRSSTGQYIIRVDGTAADFGLNLLAAAPVGDGEGEAADMPVDREYAQAADEVFAGEAWA